MKKILVAVLLLIVAVVGYLWIYYDWFCISDEETCNGQMDIDWSKEYEFSNDEIHSSFQAQFESQFIQRLLSSWNITQSHFATKAGESGTYNPPSKIQFITDDTAS